MTLTTSSAVCVNSTAFTPGLVTRHRKGRGEATPSSVVQSFPLTTARLDFYKNFDRLSLLGRLNAGEWGTGPCLNYFNVIQPRLTFLQTMNRLQSMSQCKDDSCDGVHCPGCGGHKVGWYDTGYCSECLEAANDRAEANRETPIGEQLDGNGELD